jgi:hypothetical protein
MVNDKVNDTVNVRIIHTEGALKRKEPGAADFRVAQNGPLLL